MTQERIQEIDLDAQIKKWVIEAEEAPEPGASIKNTLLQKGDFETEASVKISSIRSAGYVKVYNTETGDESLCNRNMLDSQLRKRLPSGKLAFSIYPIEGLKPNVGTLKCMLHSEGPNRDAYDEMGLPVCPKSNIRNKHEVTRHMQKRHPVEWAAIQDMKREQKEEEERLFRERQLEAMAGLRPSVAPKRKKKGG